MASLEDEQDVAAARLVKAETRADKAEFDDSAARVDRAAEDEPADEKYLELIQQVCSL